MRLQPLVLNIGQASGVAAALAAKRGIDPWELEAASVQQALLHDPMAPAAVMPIWDWPIWHPHWREAQLRALNDLGAVDSGGHLDRSVRQGLDCPDADQAPLERKAIELVGYLRRDQDQAYTLRTERTELRLITLEPGVEHCLSEHPIDTPLRLVAVENPWGGWWRVLRVLNQSKRS